MLERIICLIVFVAAGSMVGGICSGSSTHTPNSTVCSASRNTVTRRHPSVWRRWRY